MSNDLIIRGGTIVDGTGAPARPGDVAVRDGRISEVGRVTGRGDKEIDAGGLVVAPGFIDPHTHYDAPLTWDPLASCSSWHGITTIVTGNCGFTLAARGIAWSFVDGGAVVQDGRRPESPERRGRGRVLRPAQA